MNKPTALIADDEPLLRERLAGLLQRLWPQLQVVAQARQGLEAVAMAQAHAPQVLFLDVHMPGLDGVQVAQQVLAHAQQTARPRPLVVFATAFDRYAVQAFEQGAVDYVLKPYDEARLADTVARLRERLSAPPGAGLQPALLQHLATLLQQPHVAGPKLKWIKASVGNSVRLIPVEEVVYLRSDEKYTLVVWAGGEALIRKGLKELAEELDGEVFVQVHRSVIVNLHHVAQVLRGANETADIQLRGRSELLPVSRSYLHLFKQM